MLKLSRSKLDQKKFMEKQNKNELEELLKLENKQMYSSDHIKYMMAGYYELSYDAELLFFPALSKLPHNIIKFAIKNLFFLTSTSKGGGVRTFLITNKYQAIIHFHPLFWQRSENDIEDGITHEIAHAYLKHRFDTDNENKDIEKDADELASKWLNRKVTIGKANHEH